MSTNTLQPPAVVAEPRAAAPDLDFVRRSKPVGILADALVLAKRYLKRVPRELEWLIGVTVMPIMFLLLFRYIFADTVQATMPAGVDAVNYLVAGILVQGLVFGSMNTGLGLAVDAKEGLMERFASLPMSLGGGAGRILADMAITIFTTTITIGVGLLVGFGRTPASLAGWRRSG